MHPTVGIFSSRNQAEQAGHDLLNSGIAGDAINYFTGECSPEEIESIRTTDAEAQGMGKPWERSWGALSEPAQVYRWEA